MLRRSQREGRGRARPRLGEDAASEDATVGEQVTQILDGTGWRARLRAFCISRISLFILLLLYQHKLANFTFCGDQRASSSSSFCFQWRVCGQLPGAQLHFSWGATSLFILLFLYQHKLANYIFHGEQRASSSSYFCISTSLLTSLFMGSKEPLHPPLFVSAQAC